MRKGCLYLCSITLLFGIVCLKLSSNQNNIKVGNNISQSSSFDYNPGMPDPNEIYNAVNIERKKHGLKILTPNKNLGLVAKSRAKDMSTNDYYAHKNLRGLYFYDILKIVDIKVGFACENLNMQAGVEANRFVNGWLYSKNGHRECMLSNKINQVGYAVAPSKIIETSNGPKQNYIVVAIQAEM